MIVLLYKYIIKYVVFDYLPDEDKFPCWYIDNFGIISQVEWRKQDKIKIFLKPKCENGKEILKTWGQTTPVRRLDAGTM
jgi:hypothetical protein